MMILRKFLINIIIASFLFCNYFEKKEDTFGELFPIGLFYILTKPDERSKCIQTDNFKSYLTHGENNFLACGETDYNTYSCKYSRDPYSGNDAIETIYIEETCKEIGYVDDMIYGGTPVNFRCYYSNPSYTTTSNYYPRCGKTIIQNSVNNGIILDIDTVLPNVESTSPTDETTPISKLSPVLVVFSEDMNENSLTTDNVIVELNGSQVPISVVKGKSYMNIFPYPITDDWIISQVYTITISKNVEDYSGNQMGTDYTFKFEAE